MIKPETIKNPLTLLGLFASLSEVSMTVALIKLPLEIQKTFIWFVIFYPALLTLGFFYFLYKKPQSLYGPSDFKDEANYFHSLQQEELRILRMYPIEPSVQAKSTTTVLTTSQITRFDLLKSNNLYAFLSTRLQINHDDITQIINRTNILDELPANIYAFTRNEDNKHRTERILAKFPEAADDFKVLKNQLKGGE